MTTHFGDIRSALAAGDIPTLINVLESYSGDPKAAIAYVKGHLGYLPASYWVCEKRRTTCLKAAIGLSESRALQAFVSIGGEPFRIASWSDPYSPIMIATLPLKRKILTLLISPVIRLKAETLLAMTLDSNGQALYRNQIKSLLQLQVFFTQALQYPLDQIPSFPTQRLILDTVFSLSIYTCLSNLELIYGCTLSPSQVSPLISSFFPPYHTPLTLITEQLLINYNTPNPTPNPT